MLRSLHVVRDRACARQDDAGFTLIEAIVALSILVLVVFALMGTISSLAVSQIANRTRTTGTTIGSEMIERARALAFTRLAVLDDGTVPSTYTVNGTSYTVAKGTPCAGCLPYKQNVTVRSTTYAVTQLVLNRQSYTNADGNPVTEKQVLVDVTWTKPRPGAFHIQTIINDQTPLTPVPVQGLRIEAHDDSDNLIEAEEISFDISVTGPVNRTGKTEDGVWLDASLPVGSYTCVISTNLDSATYHVAGQGAGVRSVSQPCTVNANDVTLSSSMWTDSAGCPTGTGTGGLTVTASDASSNPLAGATVALTRMSDNAAMTPAGTTASDGTTTFTGLTDGSYQYAVSKAGYSSPVTGSVCVFANYTVTSQVTMSPAASPAPSPSGTASPAPPTTATVNVSIVRKLKGTKLYRVRIQGGPSGQVDRTISINQGCTGTVSFTGVLFGTYSVLIYEESNTGSLNLKTTFSNQSWTVGSPPYSLSWTAGTTTGLTCAP
jgi:Tfp pilus assembly protein PilV